MRDHLFTFPARTSIPGLPSSRRAGHSILEVLVSFGILVLGALGFLKVMVSASKVSSSSHETTLAKEAARTQMETLMSMDYRQAFTRFNASAADDPAAPTLSPGANFNVEGLEPLEADADGMAGEIIFPTDSLNPTQLREDLSDVTLGCPMDLNGDQLIDSAADLDANRSRAGDHAHPGQAQAWFYGGGRLFMVRGLEAASGIEDSLRG